MTASSPPIRAFQWDLARQVERLDVLLDLLPRYAEWGYQELYLHLEDAVEYPSLPGVARGDAYSHDELARLVDAARAVGIGVVPIVNLLGHTQYLIKVPELRDLNELRAPDGAPLEQGQICPLHPETPRVAEALLRDMAPFCTTGKVHVGLDESFHLGKCPRCRAEVAAAGLGGHFARHVHRLHALTRALNLRLGLWADMLCFVPEAIPLLPSDVIAYDWYYYPFRHRPKVELYNFSEYDLAAPLAEHGIEYWGCPMNGAFRYEPLPLFKDRLANLRSWWERCRQVGARGFLVTSWEAYRLALEMTTVVDAAAACLWSDPPVLDDPGMLAAGFSRLYSEVDAHAAARAAIAADRYPFSGYARWELNHRWNTVCGHGSAAAYRSEVRFFTAQARAAPRQFTALNASLRFRAYLARRDLFVRTCAHGVFALRRAVHGRRTAAQRAIIRRLLDEADEFALHIKEGRQAARTMRTRTRNPLVPGQNEAILRRDAGQLRAWQTWLAGCRRQPEHAWRASPVAGRWQLSFTVSNFAPAVQRVSVEQQEPGGAWRELHARHTIEFQSSAAERHPERPIERQFCTAVEQIDGRLRIVTKGVGQVDILNVTLSNGVAKARFGRADQSWRLGEPPPVSGLPELTRISGTLDLAFPDLEDKPLRTRG